MALASGLTMSVSGGGAGVGSAWERKKLEARKILEKAAREASPPSAARFVGRCFFHAPLH
jgi:hypothetical protein